MRDIPPFIDGKPFHWAGGESGLARSPVGSPGPGR